MSEPLSILENSPIDPLEGADAIAERLIFLVHRGVNWDVWGPRRLTYWDALTARVKAATYAGRDLNAWWQDVSARIDSKPRHKEDRRAVADALTYPDQRAVLRALRERSDVLVLRVRVAIEHARADVGDPAGTLPEAPAAGQEVPA